MVVLLHGFITDATESSFWSKHRPVDIFIVWHPYSSHVQIGALRIGHYYSGYDVSRYATKTIVIEQETEQKETG